jgi:hypothetical protein
MNIRRLLPGLFLSFCALAHAGEVVQIDVAKVFNMRPITTLLGGNLVPMDGDIDGAGGLITETAAKALGMEDPYAMPDSGVFPANNKHPLIIMPYGKDDGKSPQARKSRGEDAFSFAVPPKNYSKLWLFLASGQGVSKIKVGMTYADGTTQKRELEVPDWFWELKADDPYRCYVASNLSKWSPTKQLEKDHHYIFGLDIQPDPGKTLEKVTVVKSKPGIMAFLGATGQVGGPE